MNCRARQLSRLRYGAYRSQIPGPSRFLAYLSDGVGDTVVGQGGGLWAVGGVGGDHISDIVNNSAAAGVGWVPGGGRASEGSNNGGGCELHLDGSC